MKRSTVAPASGAPQLATMRRLEVLNRARTWVGRSRIRCTMVGTRTSVVTSFSAIRRRVSRASKCSGSTTVARSGVLSCRAAMPQV